MGKSKKTVGRALGEAAAVLADTLQARTVMVIAVGIEEDDAPTDTTTAMHIGSASCEPTDLDEVREMLAAAISALDEGHAATKDGGQWTKTLPRNKGNPLDWAG